MSEIETMDEAPHCELLVGHSKGSFARQIRLRPVWVEPDPMSRLSEIGQRSCNK
jgi:hypothetical protein